MLVGAPFAAGLTLLLRRFVTGVARRVCGGDAGASSAAASQAAIVTSLATLSMTAIDLLRAVPMLDLAFFPLPILSLLFAVLAAIVAVWLVGHVYSVAFGCSVRRGVLGEIVGLVALFLMITALVVALTQA